MRGFGNPNSNFYISHVDIENKVFIFGSPAKAVKLPEVGAYVLARISTIYSPARFWVHLPYGVEGLQRQLIKRKFSCDFSLKSS